MGPGDWFVLVTFAMCVGAGVAIGNRVAEYLVWRWEEGRRGRKR